MEEIIENQPELQLNRSQRPVIRKPALGFAVLFTAFLVMLLIVSIITVICTNALGTTGTTLRIMTVAQDILLFITPALLAALAVTRRPADFLSLTVKPRLWTTLLAIVVMVAATPAMEYIITWNQNIHFPESMKAIEDLLRSFEDEANGSIDLLLGGNSVGALILGVLLIGLLAGFSEEIFFRGAMVNLFFSTRMNRHIAIWLTGFIFSALHFQFFGFVPRLLLGVFFGYLIWWTGSLWVPVLAHATHNSIVVVYNWIQGTTQTAAMEESAVAQFTASDYVTIILSLLVTVLGIIILRRRTLKEKTWES